MSKMFYVTTAIDYVNGQPHLGHAYEKVVTDVIARAHRSLGQAVFFLTGTDEHGQKVQQAAQAEGATPQAYCDVLAARFQALTRKLDLANDDFIRTTEPRHKAIVAAVLNKLHAQGDIYKAPYTGWYSGKEETFLTEKDRRPDGTFDPFWGEVTQLVEENWYFRMGRDQAWLVDFIESHPDFVQPVYRRNEVLGFLRAEALEDLCISRPKARLNWGIPLPFDAQYVNYVWFDALVNYISAAAAHGDPVVRAALGLQPADPPPATSAPALTLWPADLHIVGKDILRFHAVFWPIMLKAMGLPLPGKILVHGWWQKDGEKMSKSTGNVVDPVAVIDDWGVDAFRYYVVRELDIGPDGNWTDAGFAARYHAELANGLGNLVNRSLSMLKRYREGIVPATSAELAGEVSEAVARVKADLLDHRLQAALESIWSIVTRANQYVDQTAPFKLAKDPGKAARLDEVLYNLAETCRVLAVLLWPFIPATGERIFGQLGLTGHPGRFTATAWGGLTPGHRIGEVAPLFPRRDAPARVLEPRNAS
ncbi:MAG: methionine--tRNA ligase [Verrucomicrobia bacterium]|nr:methionine--tRNA ligase [Verrucomicrobiota bacterium]